MSKRIANVELTSWKFSHIHRLAEIFKDEKILFNCEDYLPDPYEQNHVESWMHRIITKSKNSKHFAIVSNGKVAGGINISFKESLWKINAEITYFVAKEFRNKGVVTMAIKQAVTYIFETYKHIHRVIALTYEDNLASRKPLEKNGFNLIATLDNFLIKNEKLKNCCIYAVEKPLNFQIAS